MNLNAVGKAGPFAQYINEEIYVSDVKKANIYEVESMIVLGEGLEIEKIIAKEEKELEIKELETPVEASGERKCQHQGKNKIKG